jgi:DNA-binding NtrC family response regulator
LDENETELLNNEYKIIIDALRNNKGCITATARKLKIHRNTIYYYLKKLRININDIRSTSRFSNYNNDSQSCNNGY